jgi:HAD superfamily hydrolase (TIGR01509 family)
MGSPIAFIFDMDGVLIDSNPFHKISLRQFCLKYGQDLSEEQLREKIYGRTNKDWIVNVFGPMSHDQLMTYENEKEALFRELYQHDIKPVDGLIGFLDKLDAQQIPRAIGTSAPRVNVDFTLSKTHMEKYFSVILDEDFVTRGKPDPEIYLKVAAALNFKPEHCVVFEDSLSGVQAGKAAGCKVVGITTTHTPEELKDTDLVIDNFIDLEPKTLISRLF